MAQNSGLMQGKRGVILGVANNRSIAWASRRPAMRRARRSRDLAGRRAEEAGRALAAGTRRPVARPLRRHRSATIDAAFDVLKQKWGKIDFVVHAIAFSTRNSSTGGT